jgi:hypothetical protein
MQNIVILSVGYALCVIYAITHKPFMLSVMMLNVVMLSVVAPLSQLLSEPFLANKRCCNNLTNVSWPNDTQPMVSRYITGLGVGLNVIKLFMAAIY